MRYILLLAFSFSWSIAFSQFNLSGKLIDSNTQEALAYVNIGVVGKGVGTVSNSEGQFKLTVADSLSQEIIRLSMIGYKALEFKVEDLAKQLSETAVLPMDAEASIIKEVIVESSEFTKTKILGNKTTSTFMTGGYQIDELGNEIGIIIRTKRNKPTYLKTFNASITKNDYGKIKFRLNFYSVKNGKPDKIIIRENIFVETDIEQGIMSVDLRPYDIIVEEDFFVSLEWIEDYGEDGLDFSFALFGKPIIVRATSQDVWAKIPPFSIGFNVEVAY